MPTARYKYLTSTLLLLTLSTTAVQAHDVEDGGKGDTSAGDTTGPPYTSSNMQILGHLPLAQLGVSSSSVRAADIWGWTDPDNGDEYALISLSNQTAFVNIADPTNPTYIGSLPSHTGNSSWRDVKSYNDYAFIVADNNGSHGMQIFDLTELRDFDGSTPQTFTESAHYSGFTDAHNITINTDTGFAYVSGTNTFLGGLHTVDISDPLNPKPAKGYSGDGYTHDTQVVTYHGPDTDYTGQEIAFNANEDTITIVDVTDKSSTSSATQISRNSYAAFATVGYVHQGWLTDDHRYFLSNDELDERNHASITNTRTHIWDMQDLDKPVYLGFYEAELGSIDHNLYVVGNTAYLANYSTGLRVLDISDIANANLSEVGFVDTYPAGDGVNFNGAWSSYPFFDSGSIIVSDRNEGLFVVQHIPGDANRDGAVTVTDLSILSANFDGPGNWNTADFNRDGIVSVTDLSILAANFNTGNIEEPLDLTFDQALEIVGLSPALLPEPSSFMCLSIAALAALYRPLGNR